MMKLISNEKCILFMERLSSNQIAKWVLQSKLKEQNPSNITFFK